MDDKEPVRKLRKLNPESFDAPMIREKGDKVYHYKIGTDVVMLFTTGEMVEGVIISYNNAEDNYLVICHEQERRILPEGFPPSLVRKETTQYGIIGAKYIPDKYEITDTYIKRKRD